MGYQGNAAIVPLGIGGLHTDDPHTLIPATNLILANNVSMNRGLLEKEPGSKRYNKTAFGAGIRAVFDWWPNEAIQRLIVVAGNGLVYKMADQFTQTQITADPASEETPAALSPNNQCHIISCGQESVDRDRKLMILTGRDPIQVISGDGTTRANISAPAADWDGSNQPSFAFMHRGRVVAFGNPNDPHRVYISDDDDHESFSSGGAQYSVYPGEGERLFSGFVYKGRAFLLKYPNGVYFIDDTNPNVSQWGIVKVSSTFGAASAHPAVEALDDLIISNATGSLTSLNAVSAFGDVKSGDVLSSLRNESYMRNTTSPNGNLDRWALYYEDKKLAMFTYRSSGGTSNDRILYLDVSNQQGARVMWGTKDQANCLALMKDIYGVQRPIYGSEDGYVYQMDQVDRNVGGEAYTAEFQTPHMDFASGDPIRSESNKLFQHLELVFEPTGRWNVYVEVYIDGVYSETIPFMVSHGPVLGDFKLGRDRLTDRTPRSSMKPLHGMGKRISLRVYNEGLGENFRLTSMRVYYKYSGKQQKSATK